MNTNVKIVDVLESGSLDRTVGSSPDSGKVALPCHNTEVISQGFLFRNKILVCLAASTQL